MYWCASWWFRSCDRENYSKNSLWKPWC